MIKGFHSFLSSQRSKLNAQRVRELGIHFKRQFPSYDRTKIEYENHRGTVMVVGQKEFEARRERQLSLRRGLRPQVLTPLTGPLFSRPQVLIDGAFEGGGALGFAHLGALHAFAHCGIWFDRVAGTSAGAIVAAFVGAGYRADLNYTPDLLSPVATRQVEIGRDSLGRPITRAEGLEANADHSLNQILFEDDYRLHTDFDRVTANDLEDSLLFKNLVERQGMLNLGFNASRDEVLQKLKERFLDGKVADDAEPDEDVATAMQGIFRLMEDGGLWRGTYLRDWIERHLQAKVTGRSADGGTVAFRDLPMDVCIGCVDIGRTVVDSVFRPALPVFFSKKTSPEYSVAEAVRRSMSLPYLFYPRRMTDGRGSRVPDYTDGDVSVTYSQHWNRFLLDGGFKINLPVSVFLDRQSTFMSNQFVNDEPAKHVAIFLLDETEDAPPRPDDVRFARLPSPLRQIIQQAGDEARLTQDTPLVPDSEGIGDSSVYASDIRKRNYLLAVGLQVLDFAFGTRQALELKPIYAALPKTLFVDIGVRDPNWETGDSRINAGHFGMSKQTKRWIVRSAWEAGRRALQEVASDGIDIGISDEVTAYPLSVGITLISPTVYQVVARAKDGDTLYIDAPNLRANSRTGAVATQNTFRLGSQFGDVYDGLGATWIKTANADRDATEADLLRFTVATRCRVLLLMPVTGNPGFLGDGWTRVEDRAVHLENALPGMLAYGVWFKDFPAGEVVIGGMRSGGGRGTLQNYSVLVQAH